MEKEQSFSERVGAKLTALRLKKGKNLSTVEAAKQIGCGFRSLYRWEAGDQIPSGRNLEKLAEFYGITPEKILK